MKKVIVLVTFLGLTGLFAPARIYAEDSTQTCTQVTQYGGQISYICGAKTPVVETGLVDNLPLIGTSFVGASAFIGYFGKKIKKLA